MANPEHVAKLKEGVEAWNAWRFANREARPDLNEANLNEANLSGANLSGAKLRGANLNEANLSTRERKYGDVSYSNGVLASVSTKDQEQEMAAVNTSPNLGARALSGANLSGANLRRAILVETTLENADLTNCSIYGISAWDVKLDKNTKQTNLVITPHDEPVITVDNLEVAQFIYLLLHNEKIRDVIDTITSKVVLILGRFTEERKTVLDAIREALRQKDFTPVLFDFEKPASKDLTGTVETLARMARFIIVDLTDPSSVPHELATVVPFLRTTPVLPLRLVGSSGYSMFEDLQQAYGWVLKTYEYEDSRSLISALPGVIAPVEAKARELREEHRK